MILAIDPGNVESAYVVVDNNLYEVIEKGKVPNELLLELIEKYEMPILNENDYVAIEMIASYGMAVGKSVFDTCIWIGRFYQAIIEKYDIEPTLIYRSEEKMCLCNSMRANDSNIKQALVDRFAPDTPNKGKGTKKNQGYFYGFSKDIWQSMAVAVTFHDKYLI